MDGWDEGHIVKGEEKIIQLIERDFVDRVVSYSTYTLMELTLWSYTINNE